MFEYHGWATLRESANDEDGDFDLDLDPQTLANVQRLIAPESPFNRTIDIRVANGAWHLWLAGYHNHRDATVIDLFQSVAHVAPGSYGILYVWDDEDVEHHNEWIAWVMARGDVLPRVDHYLSPCVPVIDG